jgi:hypothetical protein
LDFFCSYSVLILVGVGALLLVVVVVVLFGVLGLVQNKRATAPLSGPLLFFLGFFFSPVPANRRRLSDYAQQSQVF